MKYDTRLLVAPQFILEDLSFPVPAILSSNQQNRKGDPIPGGGTVAWSIFFGPK